MSVQRSNNSSWIPWLHVLLSFDLLSRSSVLNRLKIAGFHKLVRKSQMCSEYHEVSFTVGEFFDETIRRGRHCGWLADVRS